MVAVGIFIAFIIALAVGIDASSRYKGKVKPLLWFLGVWGLLIAFLPAYLIVRPEKLEKE